MSMTTELLAKLGRKPLYAAFEDWLSNYINDLDVVLDEAIETASDRLDKERLTDLQNIVHAIHDIVQKEIEAKYDMMNQPEAHNPEHDVTAAEWEQSTVENAIEWTEDNE